MLKKKKNLILFLFIILFFFILDRIIKNLYFFVEKPSFFDYQENPKFIYFFQGDFFYFLVVVILFWLSFLTIRSYQQKEYSKIFCLSLIFVGGFSNFLDRLLHSFVIDYFNFFNLWAFNLADLMICVGTLLFLWQIILLGTVPKK